MNRFTTSPIQVCRDLPAWDAFNRLSMADDLEVNPSGTAIRYAYDTGNRRVAKVTLDVSESSTINDLYLYGGWQVLEERRTPSLQTNPSTTLHRQFVYGNYIDEPLVMDTNEDGDGDCIGTGDERLFYHQNTLFSVYALTNKDGDIVEAYAYDPYGKHVVIKDGNSDGKVEFDASDSRTVMGNSDFNNPYTFTGRRYDADTGLHYYRNRYYDVILGRFVSRDPVGYEDGQSLYRAYFIPKGVDPMGLCEATEMMLNTCIKVCEGVPEAIKCAISPEELFDKGWCDLTKTVGEVAVDTKSEEIAAEIANGLCAIVSKNIKKYLIGKAIDLVTKPACETACNQAVWGDLGVTLRGYADCAAARGAYTDCFNKQTKQGDSIGKCNNLEIIRKTACATGKTKNK